MGKENNILTRRSAASMILQMNVCRHKFVQIEREMTRDREIERGRGEIKREGDGERECLRETDRERL